MSKNRIKIAILLSVIIVIGFVSYIYTQNNQSIKEQVVINYYSQPDINGVVSEIISNFEKLHPDIKVNLVELPPNTDDKLITIKKAFQSGEMQVDVFDSDIVWPPIFAASGWAEPLDEHVS